jgi:proteic killer suppression protein
MVYMWQIYEAPRARKSLKRLPLEILKRYEKWKDIVQISGPQGLRSIRGFRDEALTGKLFGYRSSRLNIQYRIIYRVVANEVYVEVA